MSDRHAAGILDTCVYIDVDLIEADRLPVVPEITAVTLAELNQGVAMAKDPASRAARTEKLAAATRDFDPLPFDGSAAGRYGTLVALVLSRGRDPRPRRINLMIAAIASVKRLPLYTRNIDDFAGLDDIVTLVAV